MTDMSLAATIVLPPKFPNARDGDSVSEFCGVLVPCMEVAAVAQTVFANQSPREHLLPPHEIT
jgi:hypothetical protein